MKAFGITALCVLLACQVAVARSVDQMNTTESVECANELFDRVQTNVFAVINQVVARLEVVVQTFEQCHELPEPESHVCLDNLSEQAIDYVLALVPEINTAIDEVFLYLLNRLEDYFDCRNDEQAPDHREAYCALVLIQHLQMEFGEEIRTVESSVGEVLQGLNICIAADGPVRAQCLVDLFHTSRDFITEYMATIVNGREVFLYRLRQHLDAFYVCRLVDAPTHLLNI